jgi:hypothetical protein
MMPDQPKPSVLRRLNWRAIILGFVVDYGCSTAFGLISGIVFGVMYAGRGGDPVKVGPALLESQAYLTSALIVGSIFVVVGGFIVGRIARQSRMLNGAALGMLDMAIGLTYLGQLPSWYHAIAFSTTLPCALLGAWLAQKLYPNYEPPPPPLPPVS